MLEPNQQPTPSAHDQPVPATAAHWLGVDDDVALGCECADPALQIERWQQEIAALPGSGR